MTQIEKSRPELLAWIFAIDEVSAGVYRAKGAHPSGKVVEAIGTNYDAVLEECRESAARIRGKQVVKE